MNFIKPFSLLRILIAGIHAHALQMKIYIAPDVLLWTVKPAEEGIGAGIVFRVWNLEDENRNCVVSSPYPFKSVRAITHIENDREPLFCEDGKMNIQDGYNRLQSFRAFMDK